MEVILDFFAKAVNAILSILGKDPIVIDTNNSFFENIKSMLEGLAEYEPTVTDAGIDM